MTSVPPLAPHGIESFNDIVLKISLKMLYSLPCCYLEFFVVVNNSNSNS